MEAKANRTSGSAKRSVVVTQSIPGSVCQWGGRVVGWKECFCSSVAAITFPRLWDGKSGEPHRPFPQWCHTGQDNFPFSFIFVFFMRFFLRYFNSTMVHQFQAFLRSVNSSESGQYLWGNLNHLIFYFLYFTLKRIVFGFVIPFIDLILALRLVLIWTGQQRQFH